MSTIAIMPNRPRGALTPARPIQKSKLGPLPHHGRGLSQKE